MKLKITRPDGTTIEVEGTPEECERIAAPPVPCVSPAPPAPCVSPAPIHVDPLPAYPLPLPRFGGPVWIVPNDPWIPPQYGETTGPYWTTDRIVVCETTTAGGRHARLVADAVC